MADSASLSVSGRDSAAAANGADDSGKGWMMAPHPHRHHLRRHGWPVSSDWFVHSRYFNNVNAK
jgi:hypothetical protein